jgi:hypothetical protein
MNETDLLHNLSNLGNGIDRPQAIAALREALATITAADNVRQAGSRGRHERADRADLLRRADNYQQVLEDALPSEALVRILFEARQVLRVPDRLKTRTQRQEAEWANLCFEVLYWRYRDWLSSLVLRRRLGTRELRGQAPAVVQQALVDFWIWLRDLDELPDLTVDQMLRVRVNSDAIDQVRWLLALRPGTRPGEAGSRRLHHASEELLDGLSEEQRARDRAGQVLPPETDLADPDTPTGAILARFTPREQSIIHAVYVKEIPAKKICRRYRIRPGQLNRILDRFRAMVLCEHPRTERAFAARYQVLQERLARTRGASAILAELHAAWQRHRTDEHRVPIFRGLRRQWRHLQEGTHTLVQVRQALRRLLFQVGFLEQADSTPGRVSLLLTELARASWGDLDTTHAVTEITEQIRAELSCEPRSLAVQSRLGLKLLRLLGRAGPDRARPTLEVLARLRMELLTSRQQTSWNKVVPAVVSYLHQAAGARRDLRSHLDDVEQVLRDPDLPPEHRSRAVVRVLRLVCRLARNHHEPADTLAQHLRRLAQERAR